MNNSEPATKPRRAVVFEETTQAVEPKKGALVLMIALATVIGMIPYVSYVGRFELTILAAAMLAAVVAGAWHLSGSTSMATEKPMPGEFALAGWSSVGLTTVLSLYGLIFYWLTEGELARNFGVG